jgi:aryl-alcohol dehydrogenase-like predicted oxidoreductase
MERRRLGRLGHDSSVLIYGAAALSEVDQEAADRSVQEALEAGINHFDVAASYGDAELRLGPWMSRIRDQIFLATKVEERAADRAWASINNSLERLQVDRVDLLQLHSVGDLTTLDSVMRSGGALESAVRARDEGMVGAIGLTGHGRAAASTHLEGLRRYPFATVLTPLNPVLWREDEFRSAYGALVDEVRRQDVGLMTIKAVARRNWRDPQGEHRYATWYEPLNEAERIRAAVSWVLSHDEITGLATAGDVRLLGMIIAAERDRLDAIAAEEALRDDAEYSSPFLAMPF